MKPSTHGSLGFARPEILFLFACLLIVLSLGVPVFLEWRDYQYSQKAYQELRIMLSAADQFHREYRLWPASARDARHDIRFGLQRENGDVIRTLAAMEGEGNEDNLTNPQRLNCFELTGVSDVFVELTLDPRGNAIDPWGNPYQMVFDVNYDSICSIPESSYAAVVGEGVVMWSMGPDRRTGTRDDLRSWVIENAR
ncbi:MAG: hypothetical protein ACO3ZG_07930 [Kiritimatiellia bacterium]